MLRVVDSDGAVMETGQRNRSDSLGASRSDFDLAQRFVEQRFELRKML
jgi:hypothetical protein